MFQERSLVIGMTLVQNKKAKTNINYKDCQGFYPNSKSELHLFYMQVINNDMFCDVTS